MNRLSRDARRFGRDALRVRLRCHHRSCLLARLPVLLAFFPPFACRLLCPDRSDTRHELQGQVIPREFDERAEAGEAVIPSGYCTLRGRSWIPSARGYSRSCAAWPGTPISSPTIHRQSRGEASKGRGMGEAMPVVMLDHAQLKHRRKVVRWSFRARARAWARRP